MFRYVTIDGRADVLQVFRMTEDCMMRRLGRRGKIDSCVDQKQGRYQLGQGPVTGTDNLNFKCCVKTRFSVLLILLVFSSDHHHNDAVFGVRAGLPQRAELCLRQQGDGDQGPGGRRGPLPLPRHQTERSQVLVSMAGKFQVMDKVRMIANFCVM